MQATVDAHLTEQEAVRYASVHRLPRAYVLIKQIGRNIKFARHVMD